jgi:hypothetical protein
MDQNDSIWVLTRRRTHPTRGSARSRKTGIVWRTCRLDATLEAQIVADPVSFLMKAFWWTRLLSDIDRFSVCLSPFSNLFS